VLLADGRGGDAVALFMRLVGTPDDQVESMRQAPFWPSMEAIAPTLAYDHGAIIGERWSAPTDVAAQVSVPALVLAGDASLPFMTDTAQALSNAMPHGHVRVLEHQTHNVDAGVLAAILVDFFTS
jgi:pimeloyl-ACP methyl ester carboxylesterase